MPQSIRFFIRNRWKRTSTVLAASGEANDYEVKFLRSPALDETWRSRTLAGAYVAADLGSTFKIGAVCLVKSNLTNNGQYRIRIGNTSNFSVNLYDSGFSNRKRYYSDTEIAIAKTSEFFQNGLPITDLQKRIQRQVIVVALPAEVTARYIRIDFNDTSNPDGYMELGYVYAGRVLEPSRDLLYGWKMQRDDFVRDGQAACGQVWSSSVYNKTLVSCTLAPQRESDVTGYWLLLESLVSINEEFIVSLVQKTDTLLYSTAIYGKLVQVPSNQHAAFNTWNLNLQIEEIIA